MSHYAAVKQYAPTAWTPPPSMAFFTPAGAGVAPAHLANRPMDDESTTRTISVNVSHSSPSTSTSSTLFSDSPRRSDVDIPVELPPHSSPISSRSSYSLRSPLFIDIVIPVDPEGGVGPPAEEVVQTNSSDGQSELAYLRDSSLVPLTPNKLKPDSSSSNASRNAGAGVPLTPFTGGLTYTSPSPQDISPVGSNEADRRPLTRSRSAPLPLLRGIVDRPPTVRKGNSSPKLVRPPDLDKIDELDETDPFGASWHHPSPYEAISANIEPSPHDIQLLPVLSTSLNLNAQGPAAFVDVRSPPQPVPFSINLKPGDIYTPSASTIPSSFHNVHLAPISAPLSSAFQSSHHSYVSTSSHNHVQTAHSRQPLPPPNSRRAQSLRDPRPFRTSPQVSQQIYSDIRPRSLGNTELLPDQTTYLPSPRLAGQEAKVNSRSLEHMPSHFQGGATSPRHDYLQRLVTNQSVTNARDGAGLRGDNQLHSKPPIEFRSKASAVEQLVFPDGHREQTTVNDSQAPVIYHPLPQIVPIVRRSGSVTSASTSASVLPHHAPRRLVMPAPLQHSSLPGPTPSGSSPPVALTQPRANDIPISSASRNFLKKKQSLKREIKDPPNQSQLEVSLSVHHLNDSKEGVKDDIRAKAPRRVLSKRRG